MHGADGRRVGNGIDLSRSSVDAASPSTRATETWMIVIARHLDERDP